MDGILSGPIDLDGARRSPTVYPSLEATVGLAVVHRASGLAGTVVGMRDGGVAIRTRRGDVRLFRLDRGGFDVDGRAVTLVPPPPASGSSGPRRTASGSVAVAGAPARVARGSRILVEGVHDAELVEKVWGDDLRIEGVVVERLDGMDVLPDVVAAFGPGPDHRLGVLLDHLVTGTKEQRAAAAVTGPHVLVTGHPYVDVWQAVRPRVLGIAAWPEVPRGVPWKQGVLAALEVDEEPGRFWRRLLGAVRTYADLEAPLVGAVESLIDFVTA